MDNDSKSEKNEIFERIKELVAAETEKIENSRKQKFDEITKQLQSILSKSQNNKERKSEKRFVLKHVFKNVGGFPLDYTYYSESVKPFKVEWFMGITVRESHLELSVFCYPNAPVADDWSIETKLEFRMMGKDDKTAIKTMKYRFENERQKGITNFEGWNDVEEYLIDNNLAVEVEVEIRKMTGIEKQRIREFDESQKEVSDGILVVQDTKFYVLKMFLALQSSYFKTLFFGKFDESEKSEIELNGIEADDFQNFLELIHGESSIDDNTVAGILDLADMYDAPTATRRCEEFLLEKSQKSMVQKLQLALRYNLEKLKSKCLSEITSVSDIKSIMAENLPEMNLSTSQALLQKCIVFADK